MLGYIILVIVQFAAAFVGGPQLAGRIPGLDSGNVRVFVQAVIYALIVWVVGVVASILLKDVRMPGSATLTTALIGAIIGATILSIPQALNALYSVVHFPQAYLPIFGAILGYLVRR
jgi:hypothetical protein